MPVPQTLHKDGESASQHENAGGHQCCSSAALVPTSTYGVNVNVLDNVLLELLGLLAVVPVGRTYSFSWDCLDMCFM